MASINTTSSSTQCSCCKCHQGCCSCVWKFESYTWIKSLKEIPKFYSVTWSDWLASCNKTSMGDKCLKFFKEGYIHNIFVAKKDENFYVTGRCNHSMKKHESPHQMFAKFLNKYNKAFILAAHCSCKAGSGGHCNHIFALLLQMTEYTCDRIKDIPSYEPLSCTSQKQSWHIPRNDSIKPLPVLSTHYARATTDQEINQRKRNPVISKFYEAREKSLSVASVMDEVNYLKSLSPSPPFSYLLEDQEPAIEIMTKFGNVPLGSCLSYQLQDQHNISTVFYINDKNDSQTSARETTAIPATICLEFPDIPVMTNFLSSPASDMEDHLKSFLSANFSITHREAIDLEKRTVLQSKCLEWREKHQLLLTSSNFGKVFLRKQSPTISMLHSIYKSSSNLSNIKNIAHGKSKEIIAKKIYLKKMSRKIPGFALFEAGICVNPSVPYLGTSPDGKVYDPRATSKYGLLEIKCPFSKRRDTLSEAASDDQFYLRQVGDKFTLKEFHNFGYFCQVQGQLGITGLPWCDFCVYLSDSNQMSVERIYFNSSYWERKLLPALKLFFINHGLPFLYNNYTTCNSLTATTTVAH